MQDAPAPVKTCSSCGETKPHTEEFFHRDKGYERGLRAQCRECLKAYRREWQKRLRATDVGRANHRKYNQNWEKTERGKEKVRAIRQAYSARLREKMRREGRRMRENETPEQRQRRLAVNKAYRRRRLKEDPAFRLRIALSSRMSRALKSRGSSKGRENWEGLVGYTLQELKAHIERQFANGMSWDNYGEWHLDHIVPVAAFNWKTPDDPEFKACWALTNLRPLWASENFRKRASRLHLL